MSGQEISRTLTHLYGIVEAGEKGFATAAALFSNPALKVIARAYAQQRAADKEEILAHIRAWRPEATPAPNLAGMIHRGRVTLFAAMTIEDDQREKMILAEIAVGEGAALRAYRSALNNPQLSPQLRSMIERQQAQVRLAAERIDLLRGRDGQRLVARLFESQQSAGAAMQSLHAAGFGPDDLEKTPVSAMRLYAGHGATVRETILSGAFGGGLWGGLMGLLVGYGVTQSMPAEWVGDMAVLGTWLLVAVGFLLLGAIVASFLGLFIGMGIAEDDRFQVQDSQQDESVLLLVLAGSGRANAAIQVLDMLLHPAQWNPALKLK
jgi:uncharacterized protein (TIGR02284 family)